MTTALTDPPLRPKGFMSPCIMGNDWYAAPLVLIVALECKCWHRSAGSWSIVQLLTQFWNWFWSPWATWFTVIRFRSVCCCYLCIIVSVNNNSSVQIIASAFQIPFLEARWPRKCINLHRDSLLLSERWLSSPTLTLWIGLWLKSAVPSDTIPTSASGSRNNT